MIESIRRTISPLPNVLNTNQPDVCNIILLSLLLLLRRCRLHSAAPPTHPLRPAGLNGSYSAPLSRCLRHTVINHAVVRVFFFLRFGLLDRPVNHPPHSCLLYILWFFVILIYKWLMARLAACLLFHDATRIMIEFPYCKKKNLIIWKKGAGERALADMNYSSRCACWLHRSMLLSFSFHA